MSSNVGRNVRAQMGATFTHGLIQEIITISLIFYSLWKGKTIEISLETLFVNWANTKIVNTRFCYLIG